MPFANAQTHDFNGDEICKSSYSVWLLENTHLVGKYSLNKRIIISILDVFLYFMIDRLL